MEESAPEGDSGADKKKPVGIVRLTGIALGRLGLSLCDFHRLRPEEFSETMKAWNEREEQRVREDWERMRTLAAVVVQPHLRKPVPAKRLIPLPWDRKTRDNIPSAEESRRSFERLMERRRREGGGVGQFNAPAANGFI